MEIFVYYILPNIVLFGSLYLLGKTVETATWYLIENYSSLVAQLEDYFVDSRK